MSFRLSLPGKHIEADVTWEQIEAACAARKLVPRQMMSCSVIAWDQPRVEAPSLYTRTDERSRCPEKEDKERATNCIIELAVIDGISPGEMLAEITRPPEGHACGASILDYPCQFKAYGHAVHGTEVPGFGFARWTDADLFIGGGILWALIKWKTWAAGGCKCYEIIGKDKTRHFKECALRADFPAASTLPCEVCGGSGRQPLPVPKVKEVVTTEDRRIVELSRSQSSVLADKLERMLQLHKSKRALAEHLHIGGEHVSAILKRGPAVRMARITLKKLAKGLDVDVSSWDVSTSSVL